MATCLPIGSIAYRAYHVLLWWPTVFICLHPSSTIIATYICQVVLAAISPPLQLFGPNPLRNHLASSLLPLAKVPANHSLAGVLTHFKQIIFYLAIWWYFLLVYTRLLEHGSPSVQITSRRDWGSLSWRLVLSAICIVVWGYRYFVEGDNEEAFWGTTGKGMVSALSVFAHDPHANYQYLFLFAYRALETGSYLIFSIAVANTLPMFFLLSSVGRGKSSTEHQHLAAQGIVLYRSIAYIPIILIATLTISSYWIGVGELYGKTYILMCVGVLAGVATFTAREFVMFIAPTIATIGFAKFVVDEWLAPLAQDPLYMARMLESRIMNKYGQIFMSRIDIREDYRSRLSQQAYTYIDEHTISDEHCYLFRLPGSGTLTEPQRRDVRRSCILAQIAVFYALDQIPYVSRMEFKDDIDRLKSDLCLDKHGAIYVFHGKLLQATQHVQDVSRKETLNAIGNLVTTDWITLDCEGLAAYTASAPALEEFDAFVGGRGDRRHTQPVLSQP